MQRCPARPRSGRCSCRNRILLASPGIMKSVGPRTICCAGNLNIDQNTYIYNCPGLTLCQDHKRSSWLDSLLRLTLSGRALSNAQESIPAFNILHTRWGRDHERAPSYDNPGRPLATTTHEQPPLVEAAELRIPIDPTSQLLARG